MRGVERALMVAGLWLMSIALLAMDDGINWAEFGAGFLYGLIAWLLMGGPAPEHDERRAGARPAE